MEKVLALVLGVFLLTASCGTSKKIEQPKLPVGLEQFVLKEQFAFSCGILEAHLYQELTALQNGIEITEWFAVFLDKSKFPRPLVVGVAKGEAAEYWLDRNRDGIFDEHYKTKDALVGAYPTPCDAVK